MGIISTILIGLVVGLLARFLMPGRDPAGMIITILLGIAGALVAKYIGVGLGWYHQDEAAGFFASIIGAMVLLGIYRMAVGRKTVAHNP